MDDLGKKQLGTLHGEEDEKQVRQRERGIWAKQAVLALTFPSDWSEPAGANAGTGGTLLNASHVTTNLIKSLIQPFLRSNGIWI